VSRHRISHTIAVAFALLPLFAGTAAGALSVTIDADRDGLADDFEQRLLVRFLPEFEIATSDCDGLPSRFVEESAIPSSQVKDGTIYGQVSPIRFPEESGVFLEIHYYHLWSQDCGRAGHELDAEHVSTLVWAPDADRAPEEWVARYWYAAAHEDTLCDFGHGTRAETLDAVERGPRVWISEGKHASFLSRELCNQGCGADRCDETKRLRPPQVLNLGEQGFPLNGATWIASNKWPLASKMQFDFDAPIVARLEAGSGILPVTNRSKVSRSVLRAGNSTLGSLELSGNHTSESLSKAQTSTGRALHISWSKVSHSLRRTSSAVGRAMSSVSSNDLGAGNSHR
jgi:hypothetical protein